MLGNLAVHLRHATVTQPSSQRWPFWGSEALENYIAKRKPQQLKEGNFAARERSETGFTAWPEKFERRLNGAVAASFGAAE